MEEVTNIEGTRELKSLGCEHNKMKLSITAEDMFRYRSLSCKIPDIEEIAYTLDFVPKLKPKKHDRLPSPMNLNAKGLRSLKKNKKSKFLIEINNFYISCPEKDDIESDSSEGTQAGSTKGGNCPFALSKKEIKNQTKNFCNEYENLKIRENKENLPSMRDKFSLDEDELNELRFRSKKAYTKKFTKSESNNFFEEDENFLKTKALTIDFSTALKRKDKKSRTSSILEKLERNVDQIRKLTYGDI